MDWWRELNESERARAREDREAGHRVGERLARFPLPVAIVLVLGVLIVWLLGPSALLLALRDMGARFGS